MAGILPGYAADQALDPLAPVDYYIGWPDKTQMWPIDESSVGSAGVIQLMDTGTGYAQGSYVDVPLYGGSGTGCLVTISIGPDGSLSVYEPGSSEGSGYHEADQLYPLDADLGASGTGTGIRFLVVGTGVPAALKGSVPKLTVEEQIQKMNRKELEAFMVREGMTRFDDHGVYSGGLNPVDFRQVSALREAVAEAWKLIQEGKS